jgi:hypothetical protein
MCVNHSLLSWPHAARIQRSSFSRSEDNQRLHDVIEILVRHLECSIQRSNFKGRSTEPSSILERLEFVQSARPVFV